jgi:hypothetical protein
LAGRNSDIPHFGSGGSPSQATRRGPLGVEAIKGSDQSGGAASRGSWGFRSIGVSLSRRATSSSGSLYERVGWSDTPGSRPVHLRIIRSNRGFIFDQGRSALANSSSMRPYANSIGMRRPLREINSCRDRGEHCQFPALDRGRWRSLNLIGRVDRALGEPHHRCVVGPLRQLYFHFASTSRAIVGWQENCKVS